MLAAINGQPSRKGINGQQHRRTTILLCKFFDSTFSQMIWLKLWAWSICCCFFFLKNIVKSMSGFKMHQPVLSMGLAVTASQSLTSQAQCWCSLTKYNNSCSIYYADRLQFQANVPLNLNTFKKSETLILNGFMQAVWHWSVLYKKFHLWVTLKDKTCGKFTWKHFAAKNCFQALWMNF